MKRLLACAAWGAVALVPVAAGAVQTTVITQTAAPVQIESCSIDVTLDVSTPWFNQSSGGSGSAEPAYAYDGRIYANRTSQPAYTDSEVGPDPASVNGSQVYATAQSVNRSAKTVTGVVYEFNVLKGNGKSPIAVFYGGRTGSFGENVVIWPEGHGLPQWGTSVGETHIGSVACFIAYVRFSDGSDWTSPMAVLTK